jgi:hypothetical protein
MMIASAGALRVTILSHFRVGSSSLEKAVQSARRGFVVSKLEEAVLVKKTLHSAKLAPAEVMTVV